MTEQLRPTFAAANSAMASRLSGALNVRNSASAVPIESTSEPSLIAPL